MTAGEHHERQRCARRLPDEFRQDLSFAVRLFLRRGLLLAAFGEAAGLVLATSAFLAIYVPARRATRIDPLVALREP